MYSIALLKAVLYFCVCCGFVFINFAQESKENKKKEEKPDPSVSVRFVKAALGKKHTSREVRDLGRLLKQNPVIKYSLWTMSVDLDDGRDDNALFLTWKEKGISMTIVDEKITLITLYYINQEGMQTYCGEVPEGLMLSDTIDSVKKKLGNPENIVELPARSIKGSAKQWEEVWLDYSKKGVLVIFRRPEEMGGKWSLYSIGLSPPASGD